MLINQQNVYFKSMYHHLVIYNLGMPQCDIVFNFQLVIRKDVNKSQETCQYGYTKVSLYNDVLYHRNT